MVYLGKNYLIKILFLLVITSSGAVHSSSNEFFLNEIQNPEELMIANQNLDQILEHIKSMKKEFRNLIKMRYFEDMSFKEMETILNQSQNTIRVKLFRAKKMLANLLKGE